MPKLGRFTKASGETLSYKVDYSADLDVGDTLIGTAASVAGDGALTVLGAVFIETGAIHMASIMLAGGTVGTSYTITVTTRTQSGEVFVDTFVVAVK
ncbi:hypothetical protein [Burkholderia sp. Bp8990]|uniref:phage fiber-tail adaptor protein n=1 Tax=Burkholderia sp. Bp8990 TaxID=2184552 RepID=UPI000F59C120|nr:hypothetical protein [Burkholderia sp. Bp8990]RQS39778.1 hypothetical protein DIE01_16335 [Burkholderia sp. Bp8990]